MGCISRKLPLSFVGLLHGDKRLARHEIAQSCGNYQRYGRQCQQEIHGFSYAIVKGSNILAHKYHGHRLSVYSNRIGCKHYTGKILFVIMTLHTAKYSYILRLQLPFIYGVQYKALYMVGSPGIIYQPAMFIINIEKQFIPAASIGKIIKYCLLIHNI